MQQQIAFAAFEQYWDARSLQRYMEGVYLQQPQKPGSWSAMFSHNRVSDPFAKGSEVSESGSQK